jgi:hypothetical protein
VEANTAAAAPARHPYRAAAIALAGVVLIVALAAAALYVWLGSYAPLSAKGSFAPGPGLGTPAGDATGKPSFEPIARRRTFDTAFTLENTGRFTVTVTDVERREAAGPKPVRLLVTDSATASAEPGHLHSFRDLRLGPGDTAILVVRWNLDCGTSDAVSLRYEYLSLFDRAQTLTLPFGVKPRCGAAPKP